MEDIVYECRRKRNEQCYYKRKEITDLTTLTLDVNLTQPGASATYDVVVENQGDLDAVLSSIDGVKENNNQDPKAIKVSVENIKTGDPLLAGEEKTFQVKVYWDASVDFSETNMQKEIEITLTYEQSDDGVPLPPKPGDGESIGGQTVEVVTSGDGLYEDQYEDGRYIYRGSEPNNYIQFNNELWRIIAKETDGTYKIIRDEILPQNANYTPMAYDVEIIGVTKIIHIVHIQAEVVESSQQSVEHSKHQMESIVEL